MEDSEKGRRCLKGEEDAEKGRMMRRRGDRC
jgi:hypothetical protein